MSRYTARTKVPQPTRPSAAAPRDATARPARPTQLRLDESQRQDAQRQHLDRLQPRSRPDGLPTQLRQGIEALSAVDLSDVRVHRNSDKAAALGAHAYAQGNHIHLGPGQEKHLPHEAWHVVQQRQGRVVPTHDIGGVPVNGDTSLEREADAMGSRAMSVAQRRPAAAKIPIQAVAQHGAPVAQCVGILATLTAVLAYTAWGTVLGTPLGILAAYLALRQGWESYGYHSGLTETEKKKIEDSTCTVHVIRTQRLSKWADTYQDDHISLGVKVNGQWAKQVGFWMDRSDYKEFAFLSVRNKGEVRDDSAKFEGFTHVDMSGEQVINVTHEQAADIVKRIESDEARPPKFSATGYGGYTCVTWAHDVLSSNGVTLKLHNKVLPPYPESFIPEDQMKTKTL